MTEPNEPFYIILKPLSWPNNKEVPNLLGRIVKNFYSLFDHYTPDAPEKYAARELIVHGPLKDFRLSTEWHHGHGAHGQADSIARAQREFLESVKTELDGKAVWAVRLRQLDDVFKAITKHSAIRDKIFEWLGGFPGHEAYFIAGLLIAEDVSISQSSSSNESVSLNITAPITTMAQLAAGSPISIPIGNISVGGKTGNSLLESLYGHIEGQKIIAVDCRVIRRRWLGQQINMTDKSPRASPRAFRFAGGDDELILGGKVDKGKLGPSDDDKLVVGGSVNVGELGRDVPYLALLSENQQAVTGSELGASATGDSR
ncbi:hypothetical protein FOMA001_g17875 [Fusarium oxysporum f. sp. matthiolae]|nr:hypothetical protein FOMA001_g17875 [Fusarium oxysporum f. sp. matthiolae]